MLCLLTPPQGTWLRSRLRLELLRGLLIIYWPIIILAIYKFKAWSTLVTSPNITTHLCSIWRTIVWHRDITISSSWWSQRGNIILLGIRIWSWSTSWVRHEVISLGPSWSLLTLVILKVTILKLSVWDFINMCTVLFWFMYLSESSVKSILTMPCYCSIYFCFIRVSWFETLWKSLVTSTRVLVLGIFFCFTPPLWIDYRV